MRLASRSMVRYGHVFLLGTTIWNCCAGTEIDELARDSRIVHDMAQMHFDGGDKRGAWVILDIRPSPRSGGATIPGAVIDGTPGNTSSHERTLSGQTIILEEGSWRLLQALDRYDGPRRGSFTWHKPLRTHQRTADPDDVYAPFALGGTVVCRLDLSLKDEAAFDPSFLIPRGWETEVRGAYEAFRKNLGHWTGAAAPDRLTTGANRLLAVMVFGLLAERMDLPIEVAHRAISGSTGYERSAFIFLWLTSRSNATLMALRGELDRHVRKSTPDQRRWTALGLFAVHLFRGELYNDPVIQSLADGLLSPSMQPDAYTKRALARD